ncbi:Tn3 family transposase [Streptomyces sanyensis]|uniref:Tn3 family transposase n=1 Tax=Streptomyces sanyensis TaxID=568869 RepID=UPI003D76AA93
MESPRRRGCWTCRLPRSSGARRCARRIGRECWCDGTSRRWFSPTSSRSCAAGTSRWPAQSTSAIGRGCSCPGSWSSRRYPCSVTRSASLPPPTASWKTWTSPSTAPTVRYRHIDPLFSTDPRTAVDWELIRRHWPDLMQVALSVKQGTVSSVTLLRRLNNRFRKNQIYQALREVGRAVRTTVLLRYLSDPALREQSQKATNKAEAYNGFTQAPTPRRPTLPHLRRSRSPTGSTSGRTSPPPSRGPSPPTAPACATCPCPPRSLSRSGRHPSSRAARPGRRIPPGSSPSGHGPTMPSSTNSSARA